MDRQFLDDLFIKHRPTMHRTLSFRCGIPAAHVNDLIQQAALRLMHYPPKEEIRRWGSYLVRICVNIASEWHERSRQRRPHIPVELDSADDYEALAHELTPEHIFSTEQLASIINESLHLLPLRQRQCMELHHFDGLTYKQVSKELGITMRTVLRDLTRAHELLRLVLKDHRERNQGSAEPARRNAA
jgi:RNA polymerase sigma-70 factor (ECF subfamily)